MRAAVLYDVDDIRIEERPMPEIGQGELLVESRACGICTGDVMSWYIRRKAPLVLGHEPAGVVAAVGKDVREFQRGDRVFAHHHAPCFACRFCARGDYVQCATWRKGALDPGGLAQYFRVPRENVADTLRLPPTVSFADGSLVEPLACVMKSLRRSGVRSGDSLFVIGLGVMGLMHAIVAQSWRVRVAGTDFLPERRAFAEQLGIESCEPARASAQSNVVICGPGTPEALRNAIAAAAPGGTVLMFTPLDPATPLTLDANDLYFRDIRLIASYSCGPDDTRAALDAIERGVVTAERLDATLYRLEETAEAYAALRRRAVLKPIVTFESAT